mmetsp:Transcript_23626/g.61376  ORF Transcript_23626/g.61376 Transcript_23626/m.61376 type:complete len:415 (+) Transcript_23626:318-1562(+)
MQPQRRSLLGPRWRRCDALAHLRDVQIVVLGRLVVVPKVGVQVRDGAVRVRVAHVVVNLVRELEHHQQVLDGRLGLALQALRGREPAVRAPLRQLVAVRLGQHERLLKAHHRRGAALLLQQALALPQRTGHHLRLLAHRLLCVRHAADAGCDLLLQTRLRVARRGRRRGHRRGAQGDGSGGVGEARRVGGAGARLLAELVVDGAQLVVQALYLALALPGGDAASDGTQQRNELGDAHDVHPKRSRAQHIALPAALSSFHLQLGAHPFQLLLRQALLGQAQLQQLRLLLCQRATDAGSLQERLDHAVAHPRLRGPSRTHQPRRSHGQQRTSRRRRRRDCRLQRRTVVGGRRRAGTAAVGRRGPSAETRCERNGRRRRREMCHCCVVREEQLAQEKKSCQQLKSGLRRQCQALEAW